MIMDIHESTGHGIRPICAVLGVPRSSYYHAAEPTPTQQSDQEIGDLIQAIFKRHRRCYGYRRIWEELSDHGVTCAPDRVRRIMMERGLKAIQRKTYVPRTSDGRADKPSPNLLIDQPLPDQPDQVWAGDITFIPTSTGWLYLAVVIDLCSRKIVGWSLADNLRTQLVIDALNQAIGSRSTAQKPIFHSDRGSQYVSIKYTERLAEAGIEPSVGLSRDDQWPLQGRGDPSPWALAILRGRRVRNTRMGRLVQSPAAHAAHRRYSTSRSRRAILRHAGPTSHGRIT